MALLYKDLAVSLLPLTNNPRGMRYQGQLLGIDQRVVTVRTAGIPGLKIGQPMMAEFRYDKCEYKFESRVNILTRDVFLVLDRPRVIRRTKIREAPRVPLLMLVQFNIWQTSERFQAVMRDISELGLCMTGPAALNKSALISLDFFIREAGIRIISQAQIAWCHTNLLRREPVETDDISEDYEIGVQFTTISSESRYKLGRFIYTKINEMPSSV